MFYPCHKNKNNKKKNNKKNKKNPSPKSIRRGSARRLKFDTKTTHGVLAEFRGLGVTFVQATFVLTTFLHIWNISALTDPILMKF